MFSPLDEIYFWSGIMRDHAEFIYTALAPFETEPISKATFFYKQFKEMRKVAEQLIESHDIEAATLVNQVIPLLKDFIDFKQSLLTQMLACSIHISFTPSFINHMINEANEFYRNLFTSFSNNTSDDLQTMMLLHKIWLRDASGHAASIASDLDMVESLLIEDAEKFKTKFDQLFIKAFELDQILENLLSVNERALDFFNTQVRSVMSDFIHFLNKVKMLRSECKVLGAIHPTIPDHMIREESYYLAKLNSTTFSL